MLHPTDEAALDPKPKSWYRTQRLHPIYITRNEWVHTDRVIMQLEHEGA